MTYLTNPRTKNLEEIGERFLRYKKHLIANREFYSESLYEIVSSEWYYDWGNHKCPHDAWVTSAIVTTSMSEPIHTIISINILGAFHDLTIRYTYKDVSSYELVSNSSVKLEWDIDEFIILSPTATRHRIRMTDGQVWEIDFLGDVDISIIDVE